jgi:hypothetical protein
VFIFKTYFRKFYFILIFSSLIYKNYPYIQFYVKKIRQIYLKQNKNRDKFFKEILKKEIYLKNLKIISLFSRGHF